MPFFPPVRGGFFISVIQQAATAERAISKTLVTIRDGNKSIPGSIANYVTGENEANQRGQSDKSEDRLR
ncbi:hypothetical protein BK796_21470 [Kosakonia pseudosacchari]|uniref:Uncharacterized protein n=1 Tax=Kosakonia pseudosacchari TaxID=1646340 RepID=A0ABX4IKR9_9ENTR|nr:hypothetical protein BK796_21470 [Kosakonia pseudosacchari]